MTQISEPQAFELIRRLLQSAEDYKADMILCMCPMCQLNLDAYQGRVNGYFNTNFHLPIMYFTQMLGVAFGIEPKKLGFGKELVAGRAGAQGEAERADGRGVERRASELGTYGLTVEADLSSKFCRR